jgi:16S rRNA (adenine1518-N6/adenine1519-N6)-dimethyltransferase
LTEGKLWRRTERALKESGVKPNRRLGQNFVVDEELISCILETACLKGNETVLEIGAGTGNLTEPLANRVRKVIAVEKDPDAARYLEERMAEMGNVEVVKGDILYMELPSVDRIVSNLPYSISTPITFKMLTEGDFGLAALTYQTEVAERLVALPGTPQYSRLSVMASLLASIRRVRDFPPDSFYPKPRVGSTIVAMERRDTSGFEVASLEEMLKALFSQRRRVLKKALVAYAKIRRVDRELAIVATPQYLLVKRVFEISPAEFLELNKYLDAAAKKQR